MTNLRLVNSESEFRQNFTSCTSGNALTVLYFTASWCGPCKRIAPVVQALASRFPQVNFLKIDLDSCEESAERYEVRGVPNFVFLIGDAQVYSFSGADQDQLERKVAELAETASASGTEPGWAIRQFQEVCNCSEDEAKHYLTAFNNDLDSAIASYLGDMNGEASAQPPITQGSSGTTRHIATISSIEKPTHSNGSDEEEGQAFYVGGSEGGGGQQVLGPKKNKKLTASAGNNDELVSKLFESAKNSGAEIMESTRVDALDKPKIKAFTGTAYRLGSDNNQSELISGPSGSQSAPKPTVIKMWNNGFSLDDGPLREFTDPASRDFLESIQRGEVPRELLKSVKDGEANVMLEDHRGEEYKAPVKPKIVPFSGSGNMLGGPSPKLVESSVPPGPVQPGPEVDSSKPVTKIQVRLADSTRLVIELNHTHTVGDVRRSIISQRPNYAAVRFQLMTTFPSKELTDDSATLEEAKLLNAAIVQKLA